MPARRYCAIPPIGGVPLLWWTLSSVHVAEEHRPALYPAGEKPPVNPGRTVCLHSCGLPVVSLLLGRVLRSSHYFRPSRNHPPSSTSSLRQPDRPGHKRLQATGVRCFWWTAAPSTSAQTPAIHAGKGSRPVRHNKKGPSNERGEGFDSVTPTAPAPTQTRRRREDGPRPSQLPVRRGAIPHGG